MRALTLTQPWATLVALGAKKIETRSWRTAYRGPLMIHAAKGFPAAARALCYQQPFAAVLGGAGLNTPDDLPRAALVAEVTLLDVVPTTRCDPGSDRERAFGDYSSGRFAWIFQHDVRMLPTPIPCRGMLGLWNIQQATGSLL